MPHTIRRVEYYHTSVHDRPGEALKFLKGLADLGIGMSGFTAIPAGANRTQLTIIPDDPRRLRNQSTLSGFTLEGPHFAFLVQGEDVPAALIGIHEKLSDAKINVFAATGVSGGSGRFGYLIHVGPADVEGAASVLGV